MHYPSTSGRVVWRRRRLSILCAIRRWPSFDSRQKAVLQSKITCMFIACLSCIFVILLNKFNSIQFNQRTYIIHFNQDKTLRLSAFLCCLTRDPLVIRRITDIPPFGPAHLYTDGSQVPGYCTINRNKVKSQLKKRFKFGSR